jgi:small GTP-binding protein
VTAGLRGRRSCTVTHRSCFRCGSGMRKMRAGNSRTQSLYNNWTALWDQNRYAAPQVMCGRVSGPVPVERSSTIRSPMPTAPLIAIVGRPNVGKSTLFNRLVGSRRAIVGDEPGITRDRLYGDSHWRDHDFRIVDTGGIIPEDKDFIPAEIFRQARVAFEEATAIVMVVDGRSELTAPDLELARLLQKTGKPLFLAVNKVDSIKQESFASEFARSFQYPPSTGEELMICWMRSSGYSPSRKNPIQTMATECRRPASPSAKPGVMRNRPAPATEAR